MTGLRLPTLMIPQGGGPCFFLETRPPMPANMWDGMGDHLRGLAAEVGTRPKALLVISAHWEAAAPTVHEAGAHSLYFDYYNFPPHTYQLTYPAAGSPEVAARTRALLEEAGIKTAGEQERGLDHGVFIPLKLIYPDADIPVVQLSLQAGLSPARHLEIGRALSPLRDEGVLIIGSGMTFHNLSEGPTPRTVAGADAFDRWLTEAVTADADTRTSMLTDWAGAPGARLSHPREEHLLPMMVAAGAAGADPGRQIYSERLGGVLALSGYRFG